MSGKRSRIIYHHSKKGQFEIMGLAVIMVLVTLGILFALSTMNKTDEGLKSTFSQKRMAVDFLKASLDTQSGKDECRKASMRELFQDCATAKTIKCRYSTHPNKNSCDYLAYAYGQLFLQTFSTYKQRFYFEVKGPGGDCTSAKYTSLCAISQGNVGATDSAPFEPTSTNPQPCPGERELSSQPIPIRPSGTITLTLQICGTKAEGS